MDVLARALYHQIHPLKLATDGGSAVVSVMLLSDHRLAIGLVVLLVPPVVVSVYLLAFGRLDYVPSTFAGRRLHRMTTAAMAVRLVGMVVMCVGAWLRVWWLVGLGAGAVLPVWVRVLMP